MSLDAREAAEAAFRTSSLGDMAERIVNDGRQDQIVSALAPVFRVPRLEGRIDARRLENYLSTCRMMADGLPDPQDAARAFVDIVVDGSPAPAPGSVPAPEDLEDSPAPPAEESRADAPAPGSLVEFLPRTEDEGPDAKGMTMEFPSLLLPAPAEPLHRGAWLGGVPASPSSIAIALTHLDPSEEAAIVDLEAEMEDDFETFSQRMRLSSATGAEDWTWLSETAMRAALDRPGKDEALSSAARAMAVALRATDAQLPGRAEHLARAGAVLRLGDIALEGVRDTLAIAAEMVNFSGKRRDKSWNILGNPATGTGWTPEDILARGFALHLLTGGPVSHGMAEGLADARLADLHDMATDEEVMRIGDTFENVFRDDPFAGQDAYLEIRGDPSP